MKKLLTTLMILTALTMPSFAHADITSNLQGWWKFDEGTGTSAADSSGNNYTGTLHNSPSWVTGKIGPYALLFSVASTTYVDAGIQTNLNLTHVGTVSAWIKITSGASLTTYPVVVGTNDFTNDLNGYVMSVNPVGQVEPEIANGSTFNTTFCGSVNDTAWHMASFTWDGTTFRVYIDGTLGCSAGQTVDAVSNVYPLTIGKNASNATEYFPGTIDDVRVYNRALSAADMTELYAYTGLGPKIHNFSMSLKRFMVGLGTRFNISNY